MEATRDLSSPVDSCQTHAVFAAVMMASSGSHLQTQLLWHSWMWHLSYAYCISVSRSSLGTGGLLTSLSWERSYIPNAESATFPSHPLGTCRTRPLDFRSLGPLLCSHCKMTSLALLHRPIHLPSLTPRNRRVPLQFLSVKITCNMAAYATAR